MAGTPIRVYVGTEPKTELARKVLECSIARRTTAEVVFTPMIGREWEYPADLPVGTGFSLRRWMIAAHCGWQGRAVYLDADQVVLGDIAELWELARRPTPGSVDPVVWCTWQPDKFSREPEPQTSVMVIDCGLARAWWGFHIDKVIAHLRKTPTKENYAHFMHAQWLKPHVARLPTEWNHLNVLEDGRRKDPKGRVVPATKLLHYTKEPEQPWYRPDHPHAHLWKTELTAAIRRGAVVRADLETALARWQVKEDWRDTNGLHPDYASFLGLFGGGKPGPKPAPPPPPLPSPARATAPASPPPGAAPVLWVTTASAAIHAASGEALLESFTRTQSCGTLLYCAEGFAPPAAPQVVGRSLDQDPFLADWLKRHADVIPRHLGGKHDGVCRCPGGPLAVHARNHRQPCLGFWFNRNASLWFRKIAALRLGRDLAVERDLRFVVWVDADCVFLRQATQRVVESWFRVRNRLHTHIRPSERACGLGVFYLKSKRPVLEAGVVGYNLHPQAGGGAAIDALLARYSSGKFRTDPRWDDCYQLQEALSRLPAGTHADLATAVDPKHAEVVPHSPLAPYLNHRKGRHGRGLGIMT